MKADGIENWPAERVAQWHDAVADLKAAIDDTFGATMHRNSANLIRKQAEALERFDTFFNKAMEGFTEGYADRQKPDHIICALNNAKLVVDDFRAARSATKGV